MLNHPGAITQVVDSLWGNIVSTCCRHVLNNLTACSATAALANAKQMGVAAHLVLIVTGSLSAWSLQPSEQSPPS